MVKQSSTLQFSDKTNVITGQDIIEFADEIKRLGAQHTHLAVNVSRQEWERGPVGGEFHTINIEATKPEKQRER